MAVVLERDQVMRRLLQVLQLLHSFLRGETELVAPRLQTFDDLVAVELARVNQEIVLVLGLVVLHELRIRLGREEDLMNFLQLSDNGGAVFLQL